MGTAVRRKLIEVALPLEAINREAAREKSIRHGHPSTLHLWWARRPLAAARAVLFAQLVDDPSSHPDRFPDEESVRVERERLHRLIERLVVWENTRDEALLAEAHAEILASTEGKPPPILDPFCGGGTIPLEAQRLGLEAHGSDLNPVAVLITKALIEIPPKFADRPPIFPGLADSQIRGWRGAEGMAADVRAYGEWMRDEAQRRIGHLYPRAKLPDGSTAAVIAWIWARTVTCPNPACGIEMPLVRSWWLGKKKGKEAYVVPSVVADAGAAGGRRVEFTIGHAVSGPPSANGEGTVGRVGATCIGCRSAVELKYIRAEGKAGGMTAQLMAIVAEGHRRRVYLRPTAEHEAAADVRRPNDLPDGNLPNHTLGFRVQAYGMAKWVDLFTRRQLTALTTFGDLVIAARAKAESDACAAGMPEGDGLEAGGTGAQAYADAVATYVGLGVSKTADIGNALVSWKPSMDQAIHLFTRQAVPMVWDFSETPILSTSHAGGYVVALRNLTKAMTSARARGRSAQGDATSVEFGNALISTDPPYYDNVPYADLSDFFYVWLRRSLGDVHPKLLSTLLVPKADELVANEFRHGGKANAARFFEDGFTRVFARARKSALPNYPITVFYAFKQTEATNEGQGSTGWERLLAGMITSGWQITGTWPMRSELANRIRGQESNALASSIVLALRPRPHEASSTDRRGFIAALRDELPEALRELQQGRIAPVDLPQAAIGPGMAIFSRYGSVIEGDGSPMPVRAALSHINEVLGEVLAEFEGDFDPVTRFAIAWFRQHGYGVGKFGDADNLARARATAVETIVRNGILTSGKDKVALIRPAVLPLDYDPVSDQLISVWEVLHHVVRVLEADGIDAAGRFLARVGERTDATIDVDLVKELAFLMFAVADEHKWAKEAVAFNGVATAWPDILAAARGETPTPSGQGELNYDGES